jgi:predicted NAD/FAD-binding protein
MTQLVAAALGFVPTMGDRPLANQKNGAIPGYTGNTGAQPVEQAQEETAKQRLASASQSAKVKTEFQSQDRLCKEAEISKPFSSSSLPPSLASGRLAASFMTGASAHSGGPSHLQRRPLDAAAHARDLGPFLHSLNGTAHPAPRDGRRIAVVGSGIAGLSAAWALSHQAPVTLFEAGSHFGGHTHTVDVELEGQRCGVDTGFLVFNERTYPLLIQLFAQLGVDTCASEMSFSVQLPHTGLEWSGSNLNSVFAQRRNLLRPGFWRMLRDLLRFNRLTTELAAAGHDAALAQPIGDFLNAHGFSTEFRDWYLLPMVACIWSCPTAQMLSFPISTLIRFCHNHGLLQVANRPPWFTVRGGARHYVDRLLPRIADARLNTPVTGVRRLPGSAGVVLSTAQGSERFDAVVLASHSDQSLALLSDASLAERQILGAIGYHRNRAVLHTDTALLPRRRRAWAAWNYEHGAGGQEERAVCLHYLLNRLQPLPWQQPTLVSLNPVREPDAARVLGEYDYAHPVFDRAAIAAQQRLPDIQGGGQVWFCGAWTRYGFHEDGLLSGLGVARQLMAAWSAQPRSAA